ncbi:MAG: DUF2207 domain-containing protein [Firmicutes bacterium]|nr:DUF2207 domain-containing protein [Bacillota bacterium]
MRNFKPLIIFLVFAIIFFSVPLGIILSQTPDFARIVGIDYTATIVDAPGSQGRVRITEILTFEVHAARTPFRELYRELPVTVTEGLSTSHQIISVNRVMPDGSLIPFQPALRQYMSMQDLETLGADRFFHLLPRRVVTTDGVFHRPGEIIFYIDNLFRKTVTMKVEFYMLNAVMRYGDASELYVSIFSGRSIRHLRNVDARINIPNNLMPQEGNFHAFTLGTNSNTFDFTMESDLTQTSFVFSLSGRQLRFRPFNEFIEFAIISFGDDRHVFSQHASMNDRFNDSMYQTLVAGMNRFLGGPARWRMHGGIMLGVSLLLCLLVALAFVLRHKRIAKKEKLFKPSTEIDLFRQVPGKLDVNLASELAFMKRRFGKPSVEYGAMMLSFIRKGYMNITKVNAGKKWTARNTLITILRRKPKESLTNAESIFFNIIKRQAASGAITKRQLDKGMALLGTGVMAMHKSIQDRVVTEAVQERQVQNKGYKKYVKNVGVWITLSIVAGVISTGVAVGVLLNSRVGHAFGALFIVAGMFFAIPVVLKIVSRKYILLTQKGQDEYAQWFGFYKFLKSKTLMREKSIVEVAIWEEFLVYATALGIAKEVLKAIDLCGIELGTSNMMDSRHLWRRNFMRSGSTGGGGGSGGGGSSSGGSFGGGGRGGGGGGGRR